jgi:hypothetical protein
VSGEFLLLAITSSGFRSDAVQLAYANTAVGFLCSETCTPWESALAETLQGLLAAIVSRLAETTGEVRLFSIQVSITH